MNRGGLAAVYRGGLVYSGGLVYRDGLAAMYRGGLVYRGGVVAVYRGGLAEQLSRLLARERTAVAQWRRRTSQQQLTR